MTFALNQTLLYHESQREDLGSSGGFKPNQGFTTDDLIEQYKRGNLESNFFNQDTFQVRERNLLKRERNGPFKTPLSSDPRIQLGRRHVFLLPERARPRPPRLHRRALPHGPDRAQEPADGR